MPVGGRIVVPLLSDFMARYPRVEIDGTLGDEVVDLLAERADVPRGAARRQRAGLWQAPRQSPPGRRRAGLPRAPRHACNARRPIVPQLPRHNFRRAEEGWSSRVSGSVKRLAVRGTAAAGDGETLRSLTLAGVGLARLAGFHVAGDVAAGRLVAVLEEVKPGDRGPVHLLFRADSSRGRSRGSPGAGVRRLPGGALRKALLTHLPLPNSVFILNCLVKFDS